MTKKPASGGGWQAIRYTWRKARQAGGWWKLWKAMRSRNACKTCALGMGGQKGGMVNETGGFPEVCKKSLQAMAADMQAAIPTGFWQTYSIPQLRKFTPRELEACGRLAQPLLYEKNEQYFRPIEWQDALERIVTRLRNTPPDKSFWYFSGRSSNEAAFLLQLFARSYGTNHVNNCSYYCHQASGVGLNSSIGTGTATIVLEDLEKADLVFLIGGNPASNHPRLMTSLMKIRRNRGEVIVVNPVIETGLVNFRIPSDIRSLLFGSRIASQYVQVDIGGDLALLKGIAKSIREIGAADLDFLHSHCESADAFLDDLDRTSWETIESGSGVGRNRIEEMARRYAKSKRTVFAWTMGITHHQHGVENVQAIANLALMRGMVGKPGAGLMPIRGHSNVQGIGSVGVTPRLKETILESLERKLGIRLPTTPGKDTLACMEGAHSGELDTGFCLGGNLFGSNPDSAFAASALSNLDFLVHLNTTLNTGHVQALARETLILPVLARDEEDQKTTQESMFNYVRLSDGGPQRFQGARSEVSIVCDIAAGVLGCEPIDWNQLRSHAEIRHWISQVVPGWKEIAEMDRTGQEFQIDGRTLHRPAFPTPSGKAHLHVHEIPPLRGDDQWFRLMTVRSEGQFNTVVYEEEDLYRGQQRRDVILLHPDDLKRLGLENDELVTVESRVGKMSPIRARAFSDIKPGNVLMYYPESNVLVSRQADPKSATPAFKGELVRIRPCPNA